MERVVRFVSAFSVYRDKVHAYECDEFVEEFLKHLLQLGAAANKTVRFRACQIIAEVGMLVYLLEGTRMCSNQRFKRS